VVSGDPAVADGQSDPTDEQTLYLTIIGDKVFRMMGPVSGRPPRIDELGLAGMQTIRTAPGGNLQADVRPGAGYVIADHEQPAVALTPDERPLGPAPQECPRTLPPGSTQETADGLRRQAGCRYLGSCEVGSSNCTFFYQGRG
jgi:hypothetical protein